MTAIFKADNKSIKTTTNSSFSVDKFRLEEVKAIPFDYKKEYKELYIPKNKPSIVMIPSMNYIEARGHGDPNVEAGEYKHDMFCDY